MKANREMFISVDVETSGPIPGEYSLLTIGACTVDGSDTFEARLKPVTRNAVPEALKVSGLSLDELEQSGIQPCDAMSNFRDWIARVTGGRGTPVFVGLNAPFDWSFINYYFHRYLSNNPFGFSALDIKALYMGATGCDWLEAKSSQMDKLLQTRNQDSHDALSDARYQAELFRLIRTRLMAEREALP